MRFDGVDFNVEKCRNMGKETFVKKFYKVFYLHIPEEDRKKHLSEIWDIMNEQK